MVYFGKSACKNSHENYIEIIKYVFSSYKREAPLLINTMGWVTGEPVGARLAGKDGWWDGEHAVGMAKSRPGPGLQEILLADCVLVSESTSQPLVGMWRGFGALTAAVIRRRADQGLSLLVDLIRLLAPSHVVQFSSVRCKPMPSLTPDYVDGVDGLYTRSKSKRRNRGFFLAEFAENLEFGDEEKESPVVFPGHKLICVQSDFVFRKTPRNR